MRGGWLRRVLGEPLVHFLGLGVAIFAVQPWVDRAPGEPDRRIEISRSEVEGLSEMWSRSRGRSPTPGQLRGLVADRVREEVLAREAVALGLDRDDVVVRRRLAQKMEFLLEDVATVEPSPEDLRVFFRERADRYGKPARVSFRHVFFSRERREDAEADARVALAELRRAGAEGAAAAGDPLLLEPGYRDLTDAEVAALFGNGFARAVSALVPGRWEGPVASGYGVHLVRVDERRPPRPVWLADVRDRVVRDWQHARREELEQAAYARLLAGYEVAVDLPEPLLAAGGSVAE